MVVCGKGRGKEPAPPLSFPPPLTTGPDRPPRLDATPPGAGGDDHEKRHGASRLTARTGSHIPVSGSHIPVKGSHIPVSYQVYIRYTIRLTGISPDGAEPVSVVSGGGKRKRAPPHPFFPTTTNHNSVAAAEQRLGPMPAPGYGMMPDRYDAFSFPTTTHHRHAPATPGHGL